MEVFLNTSMDICWNRRNELPACMYAFDRALSYDGAIEHTKDMCRSLQRSSTPQTASSSSTHRRFWNDCSKGHC